MKFIAPFVGLLLVTVCIWAVLQILGQIWLQLLLLLAAIGLMAITTVLLWARFRRW